VAVVTPGEVILFRLHAVQGGSGKRRGLRQAPDRRNFRDQPGSPTIVKKICIRATIGRPTTIGPSRIAIILVKSQANVFIDLHYRPAMRFAPCSVTLRHQASARGDHPSPSVNRRAKKIYRATQY
jgi:hypothetical protein